MTKNGILWEKKIDDFRKKILYYLRNKIWWRMALKVDNETKPNQIR